MPARADVAGVVLCGGASRRMGHDKARIELAGRTLLERAVAVVEPLADTVVLACGPSPRYGELGLPLALDPMPDGGPLAGLAAGIEAGAREWTVALACDMPRVDAELLGALLERAATGELDVCVPGGPRGVEPLCGVYRRTCLGPIRAALAAGERRMVSFWDGPFAASRSPLHTGVFECADAPADPTVNLNSPADLDAERQRLGAGTEERESRA